MIKVENKTKILICLWHPAPFGTVGGGWRIIKEVLKRVPNDLEIHTIDVKPSFLRDVPKIKKYEYPLPPFLDWVKEKNFVLSRVLSWIFSAISMTILAIKLNEKETFDTIYIPLAELSFTLTPAVTLKLLLRSRIKVIVSIFNLRKPDETFEVLYSNFLKQGFSTLNSVLSSILVIHTHRIVIFFANRFDKVMTLSNFFKTILKKSGIKKTITVVPVGIDNKLIDKIPRQNKIYDAIFVGRYSTEKGVYDLIDAWEIVVRKLKKAKILLVGPSSPIARETLTRKIRSSGLSYNVKLHGPESDYCKLITQLKQSRIFTFLSVAETWGIAPIEGLACGLPVVAYSLPVYRENIKECESVFLATVGNYSKAAGTIIDLLSSDEREFSILSYRAQQYSKKFDWDLQAKEFLKCLIY